MSVHYVLDIENRVVLTIFKGVVTLRDAVEECTRLQQDPAFDPGFSELVDFSAASDVQMRYTDFRSLLEIDPFACNSKRAFVIASHDAVYGTARMYQIMRGNHPWVKLFATIEEAVLWLTSPGLHGVDGP